MSKLLYPQWNGWIRKNTWEAPMYNKQNAKKYKLIQECRLSNSVSWKCVFWMTFGVWDSSQKWKAFRLFQDQKFFYNLSSKSQQIYNMFSLVLSAFKKILGRKTIRTVWKKMYNIVSILEISKYFLTLILMNDFVAY